MTLAQVNLLNAALMVGSAALAFWLPFEAFVLAYGILGPAHYLTQISWLHDRGYFTDGRGGPALLSAVAVAITVPIVLGQTYSYDWGSSLLLASILASAAFVLLDGARARWTAAGGAVLLSLLLAIHPSISLVGILLPTVIHVFVFTGAFILLGSLKARSATGYLSLAVFLACAVALLVVSDQAPTYRPSEAFRENARFMERVHASVLGALGMDGSRAERLAVMRFLAWAYTYHYLNWFSKTKVIGWHEIPRRRLVAIVALWIGSLGLYALDYRVGLASLSFLATLHVVLEFPLDVRTLAGIGGALRRRAPA